MRLQINKKILVYISFFILFSTLNNDNFFKIKFNGINQKHSKQTQKKQSKLIEEQGIAPQDEIVFLAN